MSAGQHTGDVPITRNLDSAFRHLRSEVKTRALWVDALCINQTDDKEKAVHVFKMGTVFETADSVIAWLGPEEDDSNRAVALLKALVRKVEVDWSRWAVSVRHNQGSRALTRREQRARQSLIKLLQLDGCLPWTVQDVRSVYNVLARPYFGRAWIIQEVRLAKRVTFQAGSVTISEMCLWKAVFSIKGSTPPDETSVTVADWFKTRDRIWRLAYLRATKRHISIYGLRSELGHLNCTDLRDKIHSVLGMLDEEDRHLEIIPSYTKATAMVYTDVARRWYIAKARLNLFQSCDFSSRLEDGPSWVPNWSAPLLTEWISSRWCACAWIGIEPKFDDLASRLTVTGVSAGRVIEVSDLLFEQVVNAEGIFAVIRGLQPTSENLDSLYINGQRLVEAYCRVLASDEFDHGDEYAEQNDFPAFEESVASLELCWSEEATVERFEEEFDRLKSYFRHVYTLLRHRRVYKTSDGYIGLGPADTQPDDVLCVFLGCSIPIILRPNGDQTYLVVGACYALGLMDGEVIYNNRHTAEKGLKLVQREGRPELVDEDEGVAYCYAQEMLEEAGLKVESEHPESGDLFVSSESLRAVGIKLEEFVLV